MGSHPSLDGRSRSVGPPSDPNNFQPAKTCGSSTHGYETIGRHEPSAFIGFAVHMVNSVIIGVGFALVLGPVVVGMGSGLTAGLAYGAAWWVLGPLTLMPLFMGWVWA